MNINTSELRKLKTLIQHHDLEYTRQGLQLWEMLIDFDDGDDFLAQIRLVSARRDESLYRREGLLRLSRQLKIFKNFPNRRIIAIWILRILAQQDLLPEQRTKIHSLDLERYRLSEFLREDWDNLEIYMKRFSNITCLFANGNGLCVFPERFIQLEKLEKLVLRNNSLKGLSPNINRLVHLNDLDLDKNELCQLSMHDNDQLFDQLKSLPNLKRLSLSKNILRKINHKIGDLRKLEYLDLSGNNLLHLPESIGNLTELKTIFLSQNYLFSLPTSFRNLHNLQEICLDRNVLSSQTQEDAHIFFQQLSVLPNLEYLNLDGNFLRQLPIDLIKESNVSCISLQDNHFTPDQEERLRKLLPNCEIIF